MNDFRIEDDIKALRKKLGFSQEKFAEVIGVHKHTVQNWEYHKARPTKANVQSLIAALHLKREEYPELFDFAEGIYKQPEEEVLSSENLIADNGKIFFERPFKSLLKKITPAIKTAFICAIALVVMVIVSLIVLRKLNRTSVWFSSMTFLRSDGEITIFIVLYTLAMFAVVEAIAFSVYFLYTELSGKRCFNEKAEERELGRSRKKINPSIKTAIISAAVWIVLSAVSLIVFLNLYNTTDFYYSVLFLRSNSEIVLFITLYILALFATVETITFGVYFLYTGLSRKCHFSGKTEERELENSRKKINPLIKTALISAAVWVVLSAVSFIVFSCQTLYNNPNSDWTTSFLRTGGTEEALFIVLIILYFFALFAIAATIAFGIYFLHKRIIKNITPDKI